MVHASPGRDPPVSSVAESGGRDAPSARCGKDEMASAAGELTDLQRRWLDMVLSDPGANGGVNGAADGDGDAQDSSVVELPVSADNGEGPGARGLGQGCRPEGKAAGLAGLAGLAPSPQPHHAPPQDGGMNTCSSLSNISVLSSLSGQSLGADSGKHGKHVTVHHHFHHHHHHHPSPQASGRTVSSRHRQDRDALVAFAGGATPSPRPMGTPQSLPADVSLSLSDDTSNLEEETTLLAGSVGSSPSSFLDVGVGAGGGLPPSGSGSQDGGTGGGPLGLKLLRKAPRSNEGHGQKNLGLPTRNALGRNGLIKPRTSLSKHMSALATIRPRPFWDNGTVKSPGIPSMVNSMPLSPSNLSLGSGLPLSPSNLSLGNGMPKSPSNLSMGSGAGFVRASRPGQHNFSSQGSVGSGSHHSPHSHYSHHSGSAASPAQNQRQHRSRIPSASSFASITSHASYKSYQHSLASFQESVAAASAVSVNAQGKALPASAIVLSDGRIIEGVRRRDAAMEADAVASMGDGMCASHSELLSGRPRRRSRLRVGSQGTVSDSSQLGAGIATAFSEDRASAEEDNEEASIAEFQKEAARAKMSNQFKKEIKYKLGKVVPKVPLVPKLAPGLMGVGGNGGGSGIGSGSGKVELKRASGCLT